MDPYLRDVLDVLLRMLHVVAGIAWIGASFYFVRLDLALRAPKRQEDADAGVAGEFWGVHGGGLYHSQKYRLAPAEMPEPLHWFKWEAYTTWLSGLRALRRPLLLRRGRPARRPEHRRPRGVAGDRAERRRDRARLDRLRRPLPHRRTAEPGRARRDRHRARRAGGLGRRRALRAAGGVPPGRRDARDDHGRERPLRDHPRAPQARRGDGGRSASPTRRRCSRPRTGRCTTTTSRCRCSSRCSPGHFAFVFGADDAWLVFVAIAVLTALIRVFFNRWHAGRRAWWIPAVAAVGVVALALWLQPEDSSSTVTSASRLRADPAGDRGALRAVPLGRVGAARDPVRDARADRGAGRRHRAPGSPDPRDAARERDRHHRRRARAPRRLDRVAMTSSRMRGGVLCAAVMLVLVDRVDGSCWSGCRARPVDTRDIARTRGGDVAMRHDGSADRARSRCARSRVPRPRARRDHERTPPHRKDDARSSDDSSLGSPSSSRTPDLAFRSSSSYSRPVPAKLVARVRVDFVPRLLSTYCYPYLPPRMTVDVFPRR